MKRIWETLCMGAPVLRIVLALALILLLMSGLAIPFVDPGSATYYITLVNLTVLLPLLIATVYILHTCKRRRRQGTKRLETFDSESEDGA